MVLLQHPLEFIKLGFPAALWDSAVEVATSPVPMFVITVLLHVFQATVT